MVVHVWVMMEIIRRRDKQLPFAFNSCCFCFVVVAVVVVVIVVVDDMIEDIDINEYVLFVAQCKDFCFSLGFSIYDIRYSRFDMSFRFIQYIKE